MIVPFTTDQILTLAPDAASAKAGQQLAKATNWQNLGADANAVWGECQGSGKQPYRVQVEIAAPAFKCTCPSRKFPCKHGLALLLLNTSEGALFAATNAPPWVTDWLASRQQRAERVVAKSTAAEEPLTAEQLAAKAAAQARRGAERNSRVTAGLVELQKWLDDLAREGFATLRSRGLKPWDEMAARLVDAQAPGVANRLRRASAWPFLAGVADWEKCLARDLARLYLFCKTATAGDALDAHDIKALLGTAIRQEDVMGGAAVADNWRVIAQRTTDEPPMRVRANWLQGERTRRYALVLQFAQKSLGFDRQLLPATAFEGELAFYPGAAPIRALIKTQQAVRPVSIALSPEDDPWALQAALLAANPFATETPLTLRATPQLHGNRFHLMLSAGTLPLHPQFQQGWPLLALSGGTPLKVFGEWDGDSFFPLSTQANTRLVNLDDIVQQIAA